MNTLAKRTNDLFPSIFKTDLLDDFFRNSFLDADRYVSEYAKMDVKEYDDKVDVVLDVPGFEKSDIDIKYEKGYLTLSGEATKEKEEENVKYIHKEIGSRSFSRKIYLGDAFDTAKIDATFKNGMLTISLPKNEKEKYKKIEIN